jgi:hypothetical protein
MSLSITIGNLYTTELDEEVGPQLYIDKLELPYAPSFPNDSTGQTNSRSIGYSVWSIFIVETGTYHFFNDHIGIFSEDFGTKSITAHDCLLIEQIRINYQAKINKAPGFCLDEPCDYDGNLARLIWFEWWMKWAVLNTSNPGIHYC